MSDINLHDDLEISPHPNFLQASSLKSKIAAYWECWSLAIGYFAVFAVFATFTQYLQYLQNVGGSFIPPLLLQYLLPASAVFALSQYLTAVSLLILNHQVQYLRWDVTLN